MLYVFQVVSPPIIRSSKLFTQHQVFVKLLAATASMGELEPSKKKGDKPKHKKINGITNSPTLAVAANKLDIYQMMCVQFGAHDDGRRNCLKHIEH